MEAMSTRLGTPATSLDAVSHRQEVAEAASSARRRQPDGRADSSLTSRAFARALSTRMVVLMEHARSAIEQLALAVKSEERHADAHGAMKEARHASVTRLRGKEYGPSRKFQVIFSALLRVQLREPLGEALDGLDRARSRLRGSDWIARIDNSALRST